ATRSSRTAEGSGRSGSPSRPCPSPRSRKVSDASPTAFATSAVTRSGAPASAGPPCRWSKALDFETRAARGGRDLPSASRPPPPPIYQTNVYVCEDMATVESVWEGKTSGFVYGRYGTANHTMLEELVAGLEGAEAAVACASGMGATTALLLGLFAAGDHLVSPPDL